MMTKNRRILATLASFLFLLLCACGEAESPTPTFQSAAPYEPPKNEVRTIVLAMNGMDFMTGEMYQISDAEAASASINAILEEAGADVRLELRFADGYFTATGGEGALFDLIEGTTPDEPLDLYLTNFMSGYESITYAQEVADQGLAVDFSQDLRLRHPDLYTSIPERAWQESSVNGGFYCFPLAQDMDSGGAEGQFYLDADAFQAMEVPRPATVQDLIDLLETADQEGLPTAFLAYAKSVPPLPLYREYPEWPFTVDRESRLIFHNDGTVEAYVGSEIFLRDRAFFAQIHEAGLLLPQDGGALGEGAPGALIAFPPVAPDSSNIIAAGGLPPDGPAIRLGPCADYALYISNRSKDIEAAVEMMEYLYCNQEIRDIMIGSTPNGGSWLWQWIDRPSSGDDEDSPITTSFAGSGFFFNDSKVLAASLDFSESYRLRACEYTMEELPRILGELEAQGYQSLVEEAQRQYTEFIERCR